MEIVKNASLNIEVHIPFQNRVFVFVFIYIPRSGIAGSYDISRVAIHGVPGGSVVKNSPPKAGDARDVVSITESGRFPGEGNDNPLKFFCLKNPMDRGDWQATVHGVPKSWTQLSTHTHGSPYLCLFVCLGNSILYSIVADVGILSIFSCAC